MAQWLLNAQRHWGGLLDTRTAAPLCVEAALVVAVATVMITLTFLVVVAAEVIRRRGDRRPVER